MHTPSQKQAMMKARRTLRRTRARGFTLMELMVVVVLVALLAGLAAPSMVKARNDRLTFDYARQTSALIHEARARAAGRGAAHLVVFSQAFGGGRGSVLLLEALDGAVAPSGPNPLPSCRNANFGYVKTFAAGSPVADPAGNSTIIEVLNINGATNTVQANEDIRMVGYTYSPDGTKSSPENFIGLCITPNGTTYMGHGGSMDDVLTGITTAGPFTDVVEIDVARHLSSSTIAGLNRRVIVGSGGQPRIKSQ